MSTVESMSRIGTDSEAAALEVPYRDIVEVRRARLLERASTSITQRIVELHHAGLSMASIALAMEFYEGVRLTRRQVRQRLLHEGLAR